MKPFDFLSDNFIRSSVVKNKLDQTVDKDTGIFKSKDDFLKDDFKGYPFWIANYNFFVENIKDDWLFWQFTEKGTIPGIEGPVDLNIYNGTPKMLNYQVNSK
jgi:GH25 family lysozyme M1 (1,4-beta-N-acetylmuramidase)